MVARSIKNARVLRHNPTEAETLLWQCLRNVHTGFKFRRQLPVGPYITDFACIEAKLIVEVDGGQHCENAKDEKRTRYLSGCVSTLTLALSQRERGLETSRSAKEIP